MRTCAYCGEPASGRCRDCRKLYCEEHGRVICQVCAARRRWPMTLGCLFAAFPTITFTLLGITYGLLRLDVTGAIGVFVIGVALALTLAIVRQVWLHPEGIRP